MASVEWYYAFFDTYGAAATGSKYRYISDAITPDLRSSIQQQKRMQRNSIQEKEFVALYKKQILTSDVALPTACFDNYDRIDDFAWALDIPTALLIATRKMEATCKF
ncbi:hypothetical protein GW750_00510 [bacterium]|nr:hypothetical protein [bacterium]